jgi:energy-coupling factor transport system ATP-binding protein
MTPSEPAPAVRVSGLAVTYRSATLPALRRVSLEAAPGELVAVMGATGSGKSTLVKSLARVVPCFQPAAVSGVVEVLGRRTEGLTVHDLAGTVGVIFQDFEAQLFSTNVLNEVAFAMEHLGVPDGEMPARAAAALNAVGLRGFAHRDPATLSGGEKQRLAIAGLLAIDPPVLLLDEPTTDLDPVGKTDVLALLGRLRGRGRTLVVAEHEMAAAETADRVVLLRGGEVVASASPVEILSRVEVFEACGVRPHDIAKVFCELGMADAATRGWSRERCREALCDAAYEELVRAGFPRRLGGAPDRRSEAPPTTGAAYLEASNVSFGYDGERALEDVSVAVRAGEFVAVIGQNGSGKTTLAKHLAGLLRPSAGCVRVCGADVREIPPKRMASEVGFVFQDPDLQLFSASVAEEVAFGPQNLGLPPDEVARRTRGALDAVGLSGREDADPFVLDKGDRQRLAVASVLSMSPSALVLDEPTTGLDYLEQRAMLDLLRALNARGMTVIIITHSPWVVAEYASRGVLMQAGRVLWDGPLRGLFQRHDLLSRAAFRVPDAAALGQRFGVNTLTVAELVELLRQSR